MLDQLISSTRLLVSCLPAASRIANDLEAGRQPALEDLRTLDLEDVFSR